MTTDAVYTMSDFLSIDNSDIELLESQCDGENSIITYLKDCLSILILIAVINKKNKKLCNDS